MKILVTGAAGFIGSFISHALLDRGYEVVALDNINDYYSQKLKNARLDGLQKRAGFTFYNINIADRDAMFEVANKHPEIQEIIHLAAQAGVRYSLINPYSYVESNIMGQVVMSELARKFKGLKHFVYASSSSVYGGNTKLPFSISDNVDSPVSLYAATKRADELIGHTYSHLYKIPATGLRFFTVYGPWGRPDMAYYLFAEAIKNNKPITVFDNGNMQRDFTYIDDIIGGILAALDNPPISENNKAPHRVFNLGNNKSEKLMDFINIIESSMGQKAEIIFQPRPDGDVPATYADISESTEILGYQPKISISQGIPQFIKWFKGYS